MLADQDRYQVIENIKKALKNHDFYAKVELNDPSLSDSEIADIVQSYLENHNRIGFQLKSKLADMMVSCATFFINRHTKLVGIEKVEGLSGGAIITSNHFSPLENTVVRRFVNTAFGRKLSIVSQATNFAMDGLVGYLMNYADTIPISGDYRYLNHEFLSLLREKTDQGKMVLIYPEQEMWFNYRKPRPPKRGAYYFAAKLNLPVVSCFVEIVDGEENPKGDFNKVQYVLHTLGVLYPDASKSVRENSIQMCEADYALKKEAYERIYGEPLLYDFKQTDIAGWKGVKQDERT